MRLINLLTLELEEFHDSNVPVYAILSHTWDKEEVTFQAWNTSTHGAHLHGYRKIQGFIDAATRSHEVRYGWVDTCCIDKSSSAELTEAINSMFRYYESAKACLVFLSDVAGATGRQSAGDMQEELLSQLSQTRWLSRGWTLQELIAPTSICFYDCHWNQMWSIKHQLSPDNVPTQDELFFAEFLAKQTAIPLKVLLKQSEPSEYSIARRMSWASRRQTTRVEDEAYSMIGIFGISLPLIYGEGRQAFLRLQEEILRRSTDHSIFAWSRDHVSHSPQTSHLLAESPSDFALPEHGDVIDQCFQDDEGLIGAFDLNNLGLSISLPLVPCTAHPYFHHAILNCKFQNSEKGPIALNLAGIHHDSRDSGRRKANKTRSPVLTVEAPVGADSRRCTATHCGRWSIVNEEELCRHPRISITILLARPPRPILKGFFTQGDDQAQISKFANSKRLSLVFTHIPLRSPFGRFENPQPADDWDVPSRLWYAKSAQGSISLVVGQYTLQFDFARFSDPDAPFSIDVGERDGSNGLQPSRLGRPQVLGKPLDPLRLPHFRIDMNFSQPISEGARKRFNILEIAAIQSL